MSDARQLAVPVAAQDETVALFRYGLIADLLHLPPGDRSLHARLREKADREYEIPGSARRRVAAETLRDWLYAYRRGGFDALKPRPRRDTGHARALPQAVADQLCALKEAYTAFSEVWRTRGPDGANDTPPRCQRRRVWATRGAESRARRPVRMRPRSHCGRTRRPV